MRKADIKDIKKIYKIIADAKKSLKEDDIDQWQIASMDEEFLLEQIKSGKAFVYEEEGILMAYAYLSDEKEEAYEIWEEDFEGERPLTIHTFAVCKNVMKRGVAVKYFIDIIKYAEKNHFDSLRIDTHEDNYKMRGLINKLGFRQLGEIFIDEEGRKKPRICYERIL